MSTPIIVLPLDRTAAAIDNKIVDEPHVLAHRAYRAIAPNYGAFYTESVTVTDVATQKPLKKEQFRFAEMYELPTAEFGKEICAVIIITDSTISDNVLITYQAVGGQYSSPATAIIKQIEALNLDDRPVSWPDIQNKPSDYPVSYHRHDAGDVYGFEYVVHAIDRLTSGVELGDAISHDTIYQYIDRENGKLGNALGLLDARVVAHVNDKNNPHEVTPEQLNVLTAPVVTKMVNDVSLALNAHVADSGNPHKTTAHQVGTLTTEEIELRFSDLETRLTAMIQKHIDDHLNPHQTDAHQTGTLTSAEILAALGLKQDISSAINADNFIQRFDARLLERFTFVTTL